MKRMMLVHARYAIAVAENREAGSTFGAREDDAN